VTRVLLKNGELGAFGRTDDLPHRPKLRDAEVLVYKPPNATIAFQLRALETSWSGPLH
jgi:hypothetical protein